MSKNTLKSNIAQNPVISASGGNEYKRNKPTICATISPYLKKKLDVLVAREEFSSASDLISQAVLDYIQRNFPNLKVIDNN